MQNKFDVNNFDIDIELAKKYAFRTRLRECFTDGLLTLLKWNFVFFLCCLPVITTGIAVMALLNCTNLLVMDDRPQYGAVKIFMASFKAAAKKYFVIGALFSAANLAFAAGLAFYLKMTSVSVVYVPFASASLLALVLIWSLAVHMFPLMFKETDPENCTVAMSDENISDLAKQAVTMAFLNAKKTLVTVVLSFVIVAVQLMLIPASIPVMLTLGFGIPAMAVAFSHTEPEIIDM